MLVSPLPGVARENLQEVLRHLHVKVSNLRSRPSDVTDRWLIAYVEWVNEATRMLRTQVSSRDIERLVMTRRFELLVSMIGKYPDMAHPAANDLLSTELDERAAAFDQACKALDRQVEQWMAPGLFVVLDTSVYIKHPDKLEELDVTSLIEARGEPIHVLVPMVVVDELDGLKQRGHDHARWRAGYTLAVLDRVLARPTGPAKLRPADFSALDSGDIPRGEVSVELLFDLPGHVRLPINDDEIVDRVASAQSLAGRPITLLTYDTGQSFRARAVGLRAMRLNTPLGNEPRRT